MAELLLLTLDTAVAEDLHRVGSPDAWAAVWREVYPDAIETVCFLCDRPTVFPPPSVTLPSSEPARKLIAPLCGECSQLGTLRKYGRALRILRAFHRAKTGRRLQLTFCPPTTRYPR